MLLFGDEKKPKGRPWAPAAWMVAKTSATATAATPACCPARNLGSVGIIGISSLVLLANVC